MNNTFMANPDKVERKWYVVDATGYTLGRLSSEIAKVLRGKNKAVFTPHIDTGDYVIVVNAEKIKVTGKKLDQKIYYHHSDYAILKDKLETVTPVSEKNLAILIGKNVPLDRKLEIFKRAKALRAEGTTVTIQPMRKNMKQQIEKLEAEGFKEFEKVYND